MPESNRSNPDRAGVLYVVATPLGNLDDASPRVRETLRAADVVACEDTRRTARLLSRFGIETPTVSHHRFNERARLDALLARLAAGESIAVVSDGGTPCVADPGATLVDAALAAGVRVSPVPGPSAAVALLSASGFSADRFVFDGFLPHRAADRRKRLRDLAREPRTVVLFESPHRIEATLRDLEAVLGSRRVALGRELTKLHEEVVRGTAADLRAAVAAAGARGEYVLAIEGAATEALVGGEDAETSARLRNAFARALEREDGDRRRALRVAARELGLGRAELRRRLDEIGEGQEPDRA